MRAKRSVDPGRNYYRGRGRHRDGCSERPTGYCCARSRQGHWNRSEMHDALGDGQRERPKRRLPSDKIVPEQGVMKDCEIDHESPDIGRGKHVTRDVSKDDFAAPESAFFLCRFCLTDAWWKLHRRTGAIEMFNDLRQYRNHYGLLATDIHLKTSEVYENLRLTCPTAGLIPTAMRSRNWEDRYWLD